MGIERVDQVIAALKKAGINAGRGYLAGKLPALSAPVAAVSLEQAQKSSLTVAVRLYAPAAQGGRICEELGMCAAQVMEQLGAECQVGSCSFNSTTDLFCLSVLGTFTEETVAAVVVLPRVEIDGAKVENVLDVSTAFSATVIKSGTEEGTAMVAAEKRWSVTVEDLVGAEQSPHQEVTDGFTLVLTRDGGTETYTGCGWSKIGTTATAEGIRRVRVAVTCNEPTVTAV